MTNLELKKYIDDVKEELFSRVDNKELEYKLNFAKVREVKSPCKSYDAAGWDFYVPENLNIKDFTKNVGIYVNDNLVNKTDVMSPTFLLQNADDKRELWIKFYQDRETKEIKYFNCNSGMTIISEWNAWIEHEHTYVKSIDLDTNEKILIPSGIHVNLPKNIFLKVDNKSGVASKRGLICGANIIDGDYTGEMHINLINVCNNTAIINAGDKIVQMLALFQPIMKEAVEFESIEKLYENTTSERGSDGFGSTDNK
jgi:dUTP pyrophosphatase